MIIFIEIEVSRRELLPKIFLSRALINCSSKIIISHRKYLKKLIEENDIKNSILFTKDANPRIDLINYYKKLKKKGFTIISQDEEAGYIQPSYENFSDQRHGNGEAFDFIDFFLCWGKRDHAFLSNKYRNKKCNFVNCGSPRLDIYKEKYKIGEQYLLKNSINKNYILVSLNFLCFYFRSFSERISLEADRLGDSYNRYAEEFIKREAETLYLLEKFINLIKFLSQKFPNKTIVVRPHPNFEVDRFKKITKDFPKNVQIISNGHLSEAIKNCELLIQNSCSSAVEAILANKKVINYCLDNQKYFVSDFVNHFGPKCNSEAQIIKEINKNQKVVDYKKLDERLNYKDLSLTKISNLIKKNIKNFEDKQKINFKSKYSTIPILKSILKTLYKNEMLLEKKDNVLNIKLNDFNLQNINEIIKEINNIEGETFEKKMNFRFYEDKYLVIKKVN